LLNYNLFKYSSPVFFSKDTSFGVIPTLIFKKFSQNNLSTVFITDVKYHEKNLYYLKNDILFDYKKKKEIGKLDKEIKNWQVRIAHTGLNSNTGNRVYKIKKYIKEDLFFLTYGDGIGNININKLLDFHKSHKKIVTLTSVKPPSRFGEIVVEKNKVKIFDEKPQVNVGKINGGFFVCNKKIFDYFDDDEKCSFEHNILKRLAKDGELMSYDHKDFWMPMDTHREYLILNNIWKNNPELFR
jgi:glucose-1-phosphate cytidylyltransferase